ncbi:AMP-binding protein [Actinomadura livida]|uniref:AMP-binding protein n=1 Tax=Actinomadura livida TaxID=79909 RepID=A0A7W7N0Y7_9ACTN|nr:MULTISPECIES: AMP-binding protein [Actinomadura]MBB4777397.1 fatty-acyl-CoA synthase [Actinomadura catellatispora]GGU31853.1 putative fatty-acid-CoA ligase FadD [Actinomadura livida]
MRDETIAGMLLARLGDDRPGLRSRDRTWTWDEVVRESAARASLARELRRDGPFHIGVLLENVPEYVLWLGAAALSGATVVGVNPTRTGSHLEREVRRTDPQLLVTDRAGLDLLGGLDIGVPRDRFLLVDDDGYAERVEAHACEPEADASVTPATQMLLLFTSGTTGTSKAARCSQGRLAELGRNNSAKYDVKRDDVCYCPMPLFHGNALMALWAPSLAVGATVCLTPKFSASGFLPDVRFYGATFFTYVGKAIGYVLATPERSGDADNTLTHGFGTEASPEDKAEFRRRFGATLVEGYGSSESAGMIKRVPETPPTALGRPAHDGVRIVNPETLETCKAALLDEHGRVANAEAAVGEIVDVHGAARFEGYYNDPAADAERVRHGWYWTGDLGYVDGGGFLYFAGRSGDWIRVDSENISALVTQNAVRRHPRIVDAVAFGVPDPRSGDQVMAAIEIPPGVRFEDLDLAEFLAAQDDLGTKGAPRFVRVSHALPTTGSGKLRKKEMQLEGWRTADPVYRRAARAGGAAGPAGYALMTEADKAALHAEFAAAGRRRFLP